MRFQCIMTGLLVTLFFTSCDVMESPSPEPPHSPAAATSRTSNETDRLVLVDTHMHLQGSYGQGERQVVDYGAAAANLITLMDEVGVTKSLIVHVAENPGAAQPTPYDKQLAAIQQHPGRLYFMGGGGVLNPIMEATDPQGVTSAIEAQFRETAEAVLAAGSVGFGEMISLHLCLSATHGYIHVPADHPLFFLLSDIAAEHNVPIDLHMEAVLQPVNLPAHIGRVCDQNPPTLPATIEPLERLLAHNRATPIVWQHVGWDNLGYLSVELVRELLSRHDNLYVALRVEDRPQAVGGGGAMPNRLVAENGQLEPAWKALIEDYSDRFMIGGDEFVGIPGKSFDFPESFRSSWGILDQLAAATAAAVGSENAHRLYDLHE